MGKDVLQTLEGWDGFFAVSEARRPADYPIRMKETIDLLTNARGLAPHRAEFLMREAMTSDDFPYLFGDVLDRQMLAAYKAVQPVWRNFVRFDTVNRLYPLVGGRRFAMSGGDQLLPEIAEKGEYPASDREETKYDVYARVYGRQFDISWRTLYNNAGVKALKDTPEQFGRAAARTEHRLVTATYAGDVGTHAGGNLYEVGVNASANALTIANLSTGIATMNQLTDANGEPIENTPVHLVVCPSLEDTAWEITTSLIMQWLADADDVTPPAPYATANPIPRRKLKVWVDKYLPIVDTVSDDEAWYLFSDPNDIAAIEVDYAEGHERPEICMKASNKVAVNGGTISPFEGDFATDNVFYRVRLCFGANKLDWRATYMGGYQG